MFVNILASIYYVTIIKEKGLSTWEGVMGGVQRRVTEKNWIEEKRENDAILFQLRNILSKHMREK